VEIVIARFDVWRYEQPVVIRLAPSLAIDVDQATRPTRTHGHLRCGLLAGLVARGKAVQAGGN
jgi:hypothetical protein